MSKQGILIAVADDQQGADPKIVTPDDPFPVTGTVNIDDDTPAYILEVLQDLKEYIAHSLFEQKLTNKYLAIIYGEDLQKLKQQVSDFKKATDNNCLEIEFRIMRKDKKNVWVKEIIFVTRNKEGKITESFGKVNNI